MPNLTPYGTIEALYALSQQGLTLHLLHPDNTELSEGGYAFKELAPDAWNRTDAGVMHPAVSFLFSGHAGYCSGYSLRLRGKEIGSGTFERANVRNMGDKINVTPILH